MPGRTPALTLAQLVICRPHFPWSASSCRISAGTFHKLVKYFYKYLFKYRAPQGSWKFEILRELKLKKHLIREHLVWVSESLSKHVSLSRIVAKSIRTPFPISKPPYIVQRQSFYPQNLGKLWLLAVTDYSGQWKMDPFIAYGCFSHLRTCLSKHCREPSY